MVFHCLIFNCFGCLLMKYKVSVVWQLNRSKISSGLEKPVFFCQIVSNIHRLYSAIYGVMGAWRDCVMKVSVSKSKNQTIKDIMLKYSSSTLIKKESCCSVNVGYLFLKDIRKNVRTIPSVLYVRITVLLTARLQTNSTTHLVLERITRLYLKEKLKRF